MNTNCVLSFKIITLFYFESQQSQTLNRFKIIHEFCGEKRSDFYVKGYVKSTILPGVQKPIKFQCVRMNVRVHYFRLLSFVLSNSFTQEAKCLKLFLIDGSDVIALD